MSNLVIVESPAKAKTIQKYLGKGFEVMASNGHIRDLPKAGLSVDIENNFEPKYAEISTKKDLIDKLKKEAKKSDFVYLATDPDREGEAISWHLANVLKLPFDKQNRVTFSEITKYGVEKGMSEPRAIDLDLVEAQQARRILDRIFGYQLSKVLWKKVRTGLSAGRVQSVAVRLVCDREEQIKAFKTEEYWTIEAKMKAKGSLKIFNAVLALKDKKKIKISNEKASKEILSDLEGATYTISEVSKKKRKKSPAPPFTTSTLQQEASRKLNFQARRTMKIAQELYEGVDVEGQGTMGLITYMRTDSLRISKEAQDAAEKFILSAYSKDYLPSSRRFYKTKNDAQDAHEAIRPSSPELTPEKVKSSLTLEQYKLYKLIWERFIASQMADCVQDVTSADIEAKNYTFKASGHVTVFDGFTALYIEGKDEDEEKASSMPPMKENEEVTVKEIQNLQHFTQPPARYTEASLIKALEENGVGRPSTYAPTLTTITVRGYVEREGKTLKPTNVGETITAYLKKQFTDFIDVKFTAGMENDLDEIETGKVKRVKVLKEFYKDFSKNIDEAEAGEKMRVPAEETNEICELCGKPMVIKAGRFGKFLACSAFPTCKNTKSITKPTEGFCPECGGKMITRKSKKGFSYFGCEKYPECKFMSWDKPLADKCPKCGNTLFQVKGRNGLIHCLKEGCGYEAKKKK